MRGMRSIAVGLVLLVAGACGGGGGGGGRDSELQGIYMVESHTRNNAGCADDGTPYPFGQPVFFVKWEDFFNHGALVVFACQTLEDCRAAYAEDDTLHLGGPSLDQGDDESGWTSEQAFGFELDGECQASISRDRLDKVGEDGVRVEEREFDVPSFPPEADAEDTCPEETVLELGADQPCSTMQVRIGRLIER